MRDRVCRFLREDGGQDLIEYSLIITFIAIACLAFLGIFRPGLSTIWSTGNNQLTNASAVAGN